MKDQEVQLLRSVLAGSKMPRRIASNPLGNTYWATLLRGALKALEKVAIESMDWKLTAIVKLLQSWMAEQEEGQREKTFGYDYESQSSAGDVTQEPH